MGTNSSCRLNAKKPSLKETASRFVYIYTINLSLCVYTVHIQYKNTTVLLFIAHCFVKGLHLFLILWYFWVIGRYIGESMATATKKKEKLMDQQAEIVSGNSFFADQRDEN